MTINISADEVLTVMAVFFGPISALWIQRVLDKRRETQRRQKELFRTLWATRTFPSRLNYRHVEALNMVGIDFAGHSAVVESWKEYLDILNSKAPDEEPQRQALYDDRDVKFHSLVFEISRSVGYKLTRLEVKKQWYTPIAHETWAEQETVLRQGVVSLFKNESSLPIRIVVEEPKNPN